MKSVKPKSKSSHVADHFAAICRDNFRRVYMESKKFVYGGCSLNLFFICHENNLSINVFQKTLSLWKSGSFSRRYSGSKSAKIPYLTD